MSEHVCPSCVHEINKTECHFRKKLILSATTGKKCHLKFFGELHGLVKCIFV